MNVEHGAVSPIRTWGKGYLLEWEMLEKAHSGTRIIQPGKYLRTTKPMYGWKIEGRTKEGRKKTRGIALRRIDWSTANPQNGQK